MKASAQKILEKSGAERNNAMISAAVKAQHYLSDDTKKQLSNTVQETRKKIRTCAWISITAVILCAALCALAVLWSR